MNSKKDLFTSNDSNAPWLFIHIMKTAGTSFRNYLYELKPGLVYPNKQQLIENPKRGWYLSADEFLKSFEQDNNSLNRNNYQFYFGYFPFALHEELHFNVRTAVMLRDPIRRSLSMIRHRRRSNPDRFLKMTDIEMLDVEDFRERQITNYQTKVMGLSDGRYSVNEKYKCDNQTLERAIFNLHKANYIGLTENIDDSLKVWHYTVGIQFNSTFPWLNQGSHLQKDVSVEFQEAVVPFIEYDKKLYEQAKQIFDERIRALELSSH